MVGGVTGRRWEGMWRGAKPELLSIDSFWNGNAQKRKGGQVGGTAARGNPAQGDVLLWKVWSIAPFVFHHKSIHISLAIDKTDHREGLGLIRRRIRPNYLEITCSWWNRETKMLIQIKGGIQSRSEGFQILYFCY